GKEMGFEDPYSDEPPLEKQGEMRIDLGSRSRVISRSFREDLRENRNATTDVDYPYVPSGFTNPDFRSFSEEQRGFYLRWREDVRKGIYGDTDSGYVWLLLCELINSESDPMVNLEIMRGMGLAYEQDDGNRPLIRQTYLEYAIVKGINAIDPMVRRNRISISMAVTALLDRDLERIDDAESLMILACLKHKSLRADFDSDCVGIVCDVLKRIDSMTINDGGLFGICNISMFPQNIRPFTRLKFYGKMPRQVYEFINYGSNGPFIRGLYELCKCVIHHVRRHRGRNVQPERFEGFGGDYTGVVIASVEQWFNPEQKVTSDRYGDITLDRKAVDVAESDLRIVTEMMSSEPVEDGSMERPDVVIRETYGQWPSFVSSLSQPERNLLKSLLDGNRTYDVRMVESINSKSMDAIGDTVIEEDSLVEEYREDLERTLE
ncbi:MAG: TerB N-terminal domain-containing protein, partial [Candidatus Methanomethylophilaceae archaeon]